MREVLHQLTLALALPIAVTAVWIVRGDPRDARPFESATAYRAQLASLPLPAKPLLRAPREAVEWRRASAEAELPLPPRRRALLPAPAPAQSLALTESSEPARSRVAAAPQRAAQVAASPATAEPNAAGFEAPSFTATLPGIASPSAGPARVAVTAARTRAASAAAQPAEKPVVLAVAQAVPAAAAAKPATPVASVGAGTAIPKPFAAAKLPAPAPVQPALAPSAKPAAAPVLSAASPALHHNGSPAAAPRDRAEPTPLADPWRERVKAPASSPALVHGLREIEQAFDLRLGDAKGARSPFEQLVPTLPASTPQPPELAASPAPLMAALPSPSERVPERLGFAAPVLETLAAQLDDLAAAGAALGFANERRQPPALRTIAIPEPGSAWLIGAGLAAVAAVRRRDARG